MKRNENQRKIEAKRKKQTKRKAQKERKEQQRAACKSRLEFDVPVLHRPLYREWCFSGRASGEFPFYRLGTTISLVGYPTEHDRTRQENGTTLCTFFVFSVRPAPSLVDSRFSNVEGYSISLHYYNGSADHPKERDIELVTHVGEPNRHFRSFDWVWPPDQRGYSTHGFRRCVIKSTFWGASTACADVQYFVEEFRALYHELVPRLLADAHYERGMRDSALSHLGALERIEARAAAALDEILAKLDDVTSAIRELDEAHTRLQERYLVERAAADEEVAAATVEKAQGSATIERFKRELVDVERELGTAKARGLNAIQIDSLCQIKEVILDQLRYHPEEIPRGRRRYSAAINDRVSLIDHFNGAVRRNRLDKRIRLGQRVKLIKEAIQKSALLAEAFEARERQRISLIVDGLAKEEDI